MGKAPEPPPLRVVGGCSLGSGGTPLSEGGTSSLLLPSSGCQGEEDDEGKLEEEEEEEGGSRAEEEVEEAWLVRSQRWESWLKVSRLWQARQRFRWPLEAGGGALFSRLWGTGGGGRGGW